MKHELLSAQHKKKFYKKQNISTVKKSLQIII